MRRKGERGAICQGLTACGGNDGRRGPSCGRAAPQPPQRKDSKEAARSLSLLSPRLKAIPFMANSSSQISMRYRNTCLLERQGADCVVPGSSGFGSGTGNVWSGMAPWEPICKDRPLPRPCYSFGRRWAIGDFDDPASRDVSRRAKWHERPQAAFEEAIATLPPTGLLDRNTTGRLQEPPSVIYWRAWNEEHSWLAWLRPSSGFQRGLRVNCPRRPRRLRAPASSKA